MPLSDKNIIITPNTGSSSDDPKIIFTGANTAGAYPVTLKAYPTSNGTLSIEGSAGQLFSITNQLTGTIFSVNDISGIPSIEVLDTGNVKLAQYSGNVLIGTATSDGTSKLQVSGTVAATDFNSTSDRNLKDNISVIPNALNIIRNVNGVTFNWKETGGKSAGLIAQEIEEYMPELVNTQVDGKKSLNYNGVIGILVQALKEQQQEIDDLKSKIYKEQNN